MPNGASYRLEINITLNRSFDLQTFTLWQLPSQTGIQMNSYVLRTAHGEVIAIDGGFTEDAGYLKGFLAALGNHVTAWSPYLVALPTWAVTFPRQPIRFATDGNG